MSDRTLAHLPRNVPHAAGRRRQGGFTLFELIVVIVIFSIMIGYLLTKALDNLEIAEKATMESQRMMMRAGMDLHIAGLITSGRERELARLAGSNPVQWLKENPGNYLGAFAVEPEAAADSGGWYFDTNAREIIYVAKRHAFLKPDSSGRFRIRFQVTLGKSNATQAKETQWPVLAPVEPYTWFK